MTLEAKTKAGPAAAARLASRFQVAWMNAARITSASGSSDMRPPCRRHIVPTGYEKDLDISSSGLLSLGCSRVLPRFPQRSDRRRRAAARNPSCHSVDRWKVSPGFPRMVNPESGADQAARSCSSSDEPLTSTLRPFDVMTGTSPFTATSPSAIRPSTTNRFMRERPRCCIAQILQRFPLIGGEFGIRNHRSWRPGTPRVPGMAC